MNTCDAKNLLTDIFYHVFISIGEGEGWEGLGGLVWVWGRGGGALSLEHCAYFYIIFSTAVCFVWHMKSALLSKMDLIGFLSFWHSLFHFKKIQLVFKKKKNTSKWKAKIVALKTKLTRLD